MHLWLWKLKENVHFIYLNIVLQKRLIQLIQFLFNIYSTSHLFISLCQDRDTSSDAIAEKNLVDMSACVEILGRTTYDSLLRESSKPVHFLEDLV